MNPVITVEHHGEGIVEFHCAVPGPLVTWTGSFLLSLPGFVGVLAFWAFGIAGGWGMLSLWIAVSLVMLWKKLGQIQKESLLLVHDLGIQVKRSYVSGKEDRMFVERSRLCSVIINEGVGFSAVTYYLAFITHGDQELVLAFSHLIPRIHDLIVIYHAVRSVIFGEDAPNWHAAASSLHGSKPPASRQLFTSRGPIGDSLLLPEDKKTQ